MLIAARSDGFLPPALNLLLSAGESLEEARWFRESSEPNAPFAFPFGTYAFELRAQVVAGE